MVGGVHRQSRDTESPVLAHVPQDSDSERPTKVAERVKEAHYFYSLTKRPKLRSMHANQNYEEHRAEDALAEPYLGQKSSVI